jgi:hypothetical protein
VVVLHDKTPEQDGYSALESWIPGGRIDRFEWAWTWSGQSQPERATFDDRFVLRRPPGQTGRWGIALGLQTPLPGLDGRGRVCLKVKGVHVDATTGALVPVESRLKCVRFGLDIFGRPRDGLRLFLLDEPELSQDVPFPQLSLLRAGAGHDATTASNTLLVYAAERWDPETLHVIRRGLEECRRYDASLALLVLFRENTLGGVPRDVVVDIERSARDFGLAAMVNEDVAGGWSRAYGFESGTQSWRLIAPDGTVTWSHEGSIEAAALGGALDASLVHSRAVLPVAVRPSVDIGARVSIAALRPPITAESRCPPVPLVRTEVGSIVTFVQSGSGASEAQLRKLSSQHTQRSDGPVVIAVIDGADDRGAESLKNRLGLDDFVALADPSGAIADRLGVAIWPTTVTLDGSGVVQAIDVGLGDSHLGETDRPSLV